MLLEVVSLLAGICVLLAGICIWLFLQQRRLVQRLAQQEAQLEERLELMVRQLNLYQSGTIQMGEQIVALREALDPLPERLAQLEQRDPGSLSFSQAARLAGMGASVEDLTRTCGLSQGEAQLMNRLHQSRRRSD